MKEQLVEDWAKIVINIWEERMLQLGIRDTFTLANSFAHTIHRESGGDISKIEFAFAYYGRFVDMGVGKGVPREAVEASIRKARPWYTQTFMKEVKKLQYLMAEKLNSDAIFIITDTIRSK